MALGVIVGALAGIGSDAFGSPAGADADVRAIPSSGRTSALGRMPRGVGEASGVVVSRAHSEILWTHNDAGSGPVLHAVTRAGTHRATIRVEGAVSTDWEDLGRGPCPDRTQEQHASGQDPRDRAQEQRDRERDPRARDRDPTDRNGGDPDAGDCLYIGDIGDNEALRDAYRVYVVPEPDPSSAETAEVQATVVFRYPEGPADAEALAVAPDGTVLVVTKAEARLFRLSSAAFRASAQSGRPVSVTATTLGRLRVDGGALDPVTGAAISPGGSVLALRTHRRVHLFEAGEPHQALRVCPIDIREPQGEAIDFLDEETLVLAGEAAGEAAPILSLRCGAGAVEP